MNIGEKVTLLRDTFCDGNNLRFATLMESSPTTVSNWCNANSLGKEVIIKILTKLPDVDANWLLMDNGNMLKGKNANEVPSFYLEEIKSLKAELKEAYKEIGKLEGENNIMREQIGLSQRKNGKTA
jgi:hypothetical protein